MSLDEQINTLVRDLTAVGFPLSKSEVRRRLTEILRSTLKQAAEDIRGTKMTNEQRNGDSPERYAAQFYYNQAKEEDAKHLEEL